jgi:hypothetical protein
MFYSNCKKAHDFYLLLDIKAVLHQGNNWQHAARNIFSNVAGHYQKMLRATCCQLLPWCKAAFIPHSVTF